MEIMKFFGRGFAGFGLLLAAILLAGCQTDENYKFANDPLAQGAAPADASMNGTTASSSADTSTNGSATLLGKGDEITVSFCDIPSPPLPIVDTIKDDGTVTLILDQKFRAAGKTTGALQAEIHDHYVPKYYKYLTVSIATKERFFYVGGEVRNPSRQVYSGRMTVLSAIDTAGGFTDFARKGKVQVTRLSGESFFVDCIRALKHPELNREIFPGDKIQVHRRIL